MKNKYTKNKTKKGFTLIELLAVIIILGILMIIAVPAVTKYINDSRKTSYISSAKNIISGATTLANSESLDMTDEKITYYIPAKYIKSENGQKTPYGEFTEAYVGVIYEGNQYRYFWISNDSSKQGIKIITEKDNLDIEQIEGDLIDSEIRETVETTGIEDRNRILILNLDGTWQDERTATKNLNEDGELEPVDTLLAIFLPGRDFSAKLKELAGDSAPHATSYNTNILHIKRSKVEPSDEHKQEENIVSSNDSEVPIYAWFDNDTIYWWSEDIKPNMNSDARSMFMYFQGVKDIDLKYIKTNLTTSMVSMFTGCSSLESIDVSRFDTSNVTTMMSMFFVPVDHRKSLKYIKGLENFDTHNVTNMAGMFYDQELLEEIDVSNFDTRNVITMEAMFYKNKKVKKLDLSNFNTSNVTKTKSMFYGLESIEEIDVSSFNTSKVAEMQWMFGCGEASLNCKLSNIIGLDKFDTRNVTSMQGMFSNQPKLRTLDLSSFNSSKLTNTSYMFSVNNLTTIYASPDFDVSGVTTSTNMFTKTSDGMIADSSYVLTGGQGTTFDSSHTDKEYARIDDSANGRPGYFTLKTK